VAHALSAVYLERAVNLNEQKAREEAAGTFRTMGASLAKARRADQASGDSDDEEAAQGAQPDGPFKLLLNTAEIDWAADDAAFELASAINERGVRASGRRSVSGRFPSVPMLPARSQLALVKRDEALPADGETIAQRRLRFASAAERLEMIMR
jgi:hypothetical protein